jgi:putative toxin-antitoxin system antitoxin component (TIGR02293 family)
MIWEQMAPAVAHRNKAPKDAREVRKAASDASGAGQASNIVAETRLRARSSVYDVVSDAQAEGREATTAAVQQVRGASALKAIVEIKSADELPLAPAARARTDIVKELVRHGYTDKELSDLVVPKRTLARRRADNELLTVEETDKALRLKRVAALAEQVFSDPIKAQRWMRKPKRSLSSETPLAYLASENGARIVEEMLRRIEHGIFA